MEIIINITTIKLSLEERNKLEMITIIITKEKRITTPEESRLKKLKRETA